jgi:Holliday junction resolvase RusA-like endonuclease
MSGEPLFKCVIPGRARILKNGKSIKKNFVTGKRFIGKSDRYARWEVFAKIFIYRSKPPAKPINFPVILKLTLYLKNHQHEPDLSNAYQGVEDILQKCGVIVNDRLIGGHDGSRKIIDPNEPERVVVELFTMSEG